MSAQKPAETPEYSSLAAALAAFQADLPTVHKGATGQVGQNRNYKYADLSDLSAVVLPRLGAVGLSFSTKPTVTADGRFVLAYVLRHVSGQEDGGEWPLPDGTPQQIGSALTYARRYCLQAVTGVAPDEDDDGHEAGQAQQYSRSRPQQARNAPQNGHQEPHADEPAPPSPADRARAALLAACESNGWDRTAVLAEFTKRYDGADLRTEESAPRISAFTKLLPDVFATASASNGATQ